MTVGETSTHASLPPSGSTLVARTLYISYIYYNCNDYILTIFRHLYLWHVAL